MCVKCPQCKKTINNEDIRCSPYFPFCSRKCKLVDLEGWLKNRYKITTPLNTERSNDND